MEMILQEPNEHGCYVIMLRALCAFYKLYVSFIKAKKVSKLNTKISEHVSSVTSIIQSGSNLLIDSISIRVTY